MHLLYKIINVKREKTRLTTQHGCEHLCLPQFLFLLQRFSHRKGFSSTEIKRYKYSKFKNHFNNKS